MASSYNSLVGGEGRMVSPNLVQQDASRNLSVLFQRARFLTRYTDSRGFMQQLDVILCLVDGLPAGTTACRARTHYKPEMNYTACGTCLVRMTLPNHAH